MKVVRTVTYEGPNEWVKAVLSNSLPPGKQLFLVDSEKEITITVYEKDLLAIAREGFEELSKLGNGDKPGNSIGNTIALSYLKKLTEKNENNKQS